MSVTLTAPDNGCIVDERRALHPWCDCCWGRIGNACLLDGCLAATCVRSDILALSMHRGAATGYTENYSQRANMQWQPGHDSLVQEKSEGVIADSACAQGIALPML